jgi:hypothetical protein
MQPLNECILLILATTLCQYVNAVDPIGKLKRIFYAKKRRKYIPIEYNKYGRNIYE